VRQDSFDKELELVHTLLDCLVGLPAQTALLRHRRDNVAWVLTNEDVSEPQEVTVASANLKVQRECLHKVGDVGLREKTSFYVLGAKSYILDYKSLTQRSSRKCSSRLLAL
jgi:hypothetical protein